jgi:hypothetical protein
MVTGYTVMQQRHRICRVARLESAGQALEHPLGLVGILGVLGLTRS